MGSPPVRFGIIGCAEIARKVARAVVLSPNATLHAVGSRSAEKAAVFAEENGLPDTVRLYGSYDGVLDDPEVDAVYLPLPTSLHVTWAVLAARKKKHVLLEKPVALDVKELDLILEACESSKVQFMDATMWMHHPRTPAMKEFLKDSARFGELRSISSCSSFAATKEFLETNIRVKPDLDSLGALGDLGWYCIGAILWAADFELPKSVRALPCAVVNDAGVILACGGSLLWENGVTATFHCSFFASVTMDLAVVGSNGALRVHDLAIPVEESKASFCASVNSGFRHLGSGWEPVPSEHVVDAELPQEALMVREFSRLVGRAEPDTKWGELSRKTQLVVDLVKLSMQRRYEAVEVVE